MKSVISFSIGELAKRIGAKLVGDPEIVVTHIAPVENAGPSSITFITGKKYLDTLSAANPAAVLLSTELEGATELPRLLTKDPYRGYAHLSQVWADQLRGEVSRCIHERAVVSPAAHVAAGVSVAPNAVVEAGAIIASGAEIGAGSFIGANTVVGEGSKIHPNVTVMDNIVIGAQSEIHSGAVIGADGFGWAPNGERWEKICQLGSVKIGDRVSIGACTTVDRGAIEDTVIENGVILDNHIQVAHNVVIGENTAIAGCTGIAGSTRIGRQCRIGGAVSIVGHLSICDQVTITANSFVNRSILKPGSYSSGYPVEESATWRKNAVRLHRLDQLSRLIFNKSFKNG